MRFKSWAVREAFAGHILQDRDQMIGLKYTLPLPYVVVKNVPLLTFFHIYFTATILAPILALSVPPSLRPTASL